MKTYIKPTLLGIIISLLLSSCAFNTVKPQMTSLQIQAIQSRTFDTTKKIAFNSVVSVFQDLGYIISSAEYNTGFITADSPAKAYFSFMEGGTVSEKLRATAFIEEITPGKTRVRLNFVTHKDVSQKNGSFKQDVPIELPSTYQNAFTKIQEAIFIRTPFSDNNPNHKPRSVTHSPISGQKQQTSANPNNIGNNNATN